MAHTEGEDVQRSEGIAQARYEKLREWREIALSERERGNRLEHERDALRSALEDLVEEQNGPPLLRRETQWQEAMNKARRALIIAPEGRTFKSEATHATAGEESAGGSARHVPSGEQGNGAEDQGDRRD